MPSPVKRPAPSDQDQEFNAQGYNKWMNECTQQKKNQVHQNWDKYIDTVKSYVKEVQREGEEHVKEFDKELNYIALEHVMDQSLLAFFHHKANKLPESTKCLQGAKDSLSKFVKEGHIPQRYFASFCLLLSSLSIPKTTLIADNNECSPSKKLRVDSEPSTSLDCAQKEEKEKLACLYGIKQHFFHIIRVNYDEQIKLLKQAIQYDPGFYLWHLKLYEILRKRISQGKFHHDKTRVLPSKEEKEAILTACKLQPDHPLCLAEEILMLAEQVKVQEPKLKFNKAKWAVIEHNGVNPQQLVSFLIKQSTKIMELAPTSINCHAKIAEVFNTLLPKNQRQRDLKFSEDCLNQCLKYHPNSVLLKFRLAECLVGQTSKPQQTEENSESLMSKAQDTLEGTLENCSSTGYFAPVIFLIQILLGQPVENKDKLLELFKKELENPTWSRWQLQSILFLKAIFCLNTPALYNEAIDILCKICKDNENDLKFNDLPYQSNRFGWKMSGRVNLTLYQVRDKIKNEIKSNPGLNPERKKTLRKILSKIHAAINKNKRYL